MSFMGGDPLGDLIGNARSSNADAVRRAFGSKEEKGVPWEAKVIDGKFYIPLSQVADLLEVNDVLPKVREGIKRRVEKGPDK